MKGEGIGRALAYARGDLRDWPVLCGWCESENVVLDWTNDRFRCQDCRRWTTVRVAYAERERRARREVTGR